MKTDVMRALFLGSAFVSSTAFSLGLELEFAGGIGKEKLTPRTQVSTTVETEADKAVEELRNPLVLGFRVDPRLLVIHSRTMHLGLGAGLGYEKGSSSASVQEAKIEYSYYRLMLEPNAKFTYFPSKDFGLGLGLGYYVGLTGDSETTNAIAGASASKKQKTKSDSGFRLRANTSLVLSGSNRPQILAGYQLTAGGSFEREGDTDKLDLSGHAFVLSYIYPIIFDNGVDEEKQEVPRNHVRRGDPNFDDRNQRRRKQRPR